jgi:hypothetical protein
MKRAFAIIIVLVLAIGMIGLFFSSFLAGGTTAAPTATYTTTPAPTAAAPVQ